MQEDRRGGDKEEEAQNEGTFYVKVSPNHRPERKYRTIAIEFLLTNSSSECISSICILI